MLSFHLLFALPRCVSPCLLSLLCQAKAEQFAADFAAALDALLANPRQELQGFRAQPVSCTSLCHVRCGVGWLCTVGLTAQHVIMLTFVSSLARAADDAGHFVASSAAQLIRVLSQFQPVRCTHSCVPATASRPRACVPASTTNQMEPSSADSAAGVCACVNCREQCLHNAGFVDIFKAVKQTEDEAALQLLPQVCVICVGLQVLGCRTAGSRQHHVSSTQAGHALLMLTCCMHWLRVFLQQFQSPCQSSWCLSGNHTGMCVAHST